LQLAIESGRTPVALGLGLEDYPAFKAWAQENLEAEGGVGVKYRGIPVRHLENVFLSRLELKSQPGSPNALLI
jgi:hypothetical protein